MTTHWPSRVFCFLLAVTVVNVQNAGVYFCGLPKVDALTGQKLSNSLRTSTCMLLSKNRLQNDHDVVRCTIFSSQSLQEKN